MRAKAQSNAELLRRIAQLESDINAAQRTLDELQAEIKRLRADLNAATSEPEPESCTDFRVRNAETIWAAGYMRKTDGGDWTGAWLAAMEWNAPDNENALSPEWRIDL